MKLIGIKTPLIKPGDDLLKIILESTNNGKEIREGDILVIASSVVSTTNNRLVKIEDIEAGEEAKKLAEKSRMDENLVEIIIQESDKIISPSDECILTIKDDMLRINAGVDQSNVTPGYALLLPENPDKIAKELRENIQKKTGKKIGIIISDSHVQPLRLGTIGQAIGSSGIRVAEDCRGRKDLFGRKLKITFKGIGDQLATAAQLIMGEADERIPLVIIRGVPTDIINGEGSSLRISPDECVYSKFFEKINNFYFKHA